MVRQPGSKYEIGRSSTLLKIKTFHDAEATVVAIQDGKGKHKGRMGALLVEMSDGTQFSVGTGFSDKERENPPEIGALVTFRYQELTDGGVPRFPSFVRRAIDKELDKSRTKAAAKTVGKTPAKKTTKQPVSVSPPATSNAKSSKPKSNTSASKRYFEFSEGSSSKFWEISLDSCDVTTRWGRIGTDGQAKTKTFDSAQKADAEYNKLILEKTSKGYSEVT